MREVPITEFDLYIQVYGTESSYNFTYEANFTSNTTIDVIMTFYSPIKGDGEEVYVEFPVANNITNFPFMKVDIDKTMLGKLYEIEITNSSGILGQSTFLLFLCSVFLTVISSFGGNSMEMFWKFTNTLQLIFFMSMINVKFPEVLSVYFPFLQISSAENPFFSQLSFFLIPEEHFTSGEVNDKIGPKSFYVSNADKFPIIIPLTILFAIIKVYDTIFPNPQGS